MGGKKGESEGALELGVVVPEIVMEAKDGETAQQGKKEDPKNKKKDDRKKKKKEDKNNDEDCDCDCEEPWCGGSFGNCCDCSCDCDCDCDCGDD